MLVFILYQQHRNTDGHFRELKGGGQTFFGGGASIKILKRYIVSESTESSI